MRLFLGVDGGQSGTTAVVGDEAGHILGEGHAGPCNHAASSQGRVRFAGAIIASVRAALDRAGIEQTTFEAACFGFSGGPADKNALTRELVKAKRYFITHDAWTALAGATAGKPGVIAIAGTGSIAFGRNSDDRTARAGGWGYIFGDEGGAFDVVRQALRAVLRNEEGWGPPTALRNSLLEITGAASANDLLHRCYTDELPRDRIAALAPLVDQAAGSGDPMAQDILKSAAQSLAMLIAAVRGQLFAPGENIAVTYAGGVFRSPVFRERFRMLVELEADNHVAAPRFQPAEGALIEAYRLAGISNPARLLDAGRERAGDYE
ncbi:MAG: ATPase [Bryobacterales bacterium]|nr:ATPase [Bryobacterales bacterium]MBV9400842.1 ATPase [Bryobacterales bacterium]